MRTAIASILTTLAVAGCESSAGPSLSTMLDHQVDAERNRSVWLTREGVQIHSAATQPVSVALPGWTYAGAPHCPPVVALGPAGEILVTSNVLPTLWRIDAATLAVTVHPLVLASDQEKDVGFAALAYVPEERAYLAYSETLRSLWRVDVALTGAVKQAVGMARQRSAKGRHRACAELARRLAVLP